MASLLLFCLGLVQLGCSGLAQQRDFLVTAPRLLRLDAMETVVVQVFDEAEASVQVYLKKSLAPGDTTYATETVQLNAGNNYQGSAKMRLFSKDFPPDATHVYLHAVSSGINSHEKIPVSRDNGFLFIQTDKPLYTPEQSVKIRVYSLNEELSPARRKVTLTFRDPDAVKVDVVDLEDVSGIISMQRDFKVPLKPKLGLWTIEASYTDDFSTTAQTQFEVKKYVLPSIIVTLQPEQSYITEANMNSFKLSVTARYAHGAPVIEGLAMMRFGYISGHQTVVLPKTFRTAELTETGEAELTLNIREALDAAPEGPKDLQGLEGQYLYVLVTVEESTGGMSQQAELVNVKFAASPFTLRLIATPPFIKPGLPYGIRALVRNPLGRPVSGVAVKIRASLTQTDGVQEPLLSSSLERDTTRQSLRDGVAHFTYNIPSTANKAEFFLETADPRLPSENQASLSYKADAYASTRGRYVYIDLPDAVSSVQVSDYLNIKVYFEYREFLTLKTFSYQVLSRGRVVKYATLPRSGTKTEIISLRVTPEMVPSARLIVYYVQTGEGAAELVADSVWFDVHHKCVNGLNMALSVPESQYKPKDNVTLKLETSESSVVALSAVDTSLYALRLNQKDPLNNVLRHVELKDTGCGGGGGKDGSDVFRRAGLMFMTNANAKAIIEGDTCSDIIRSKRAISTQADFEASVNKLPTQKHKDVCWQGFHSNPILESCEVRARSLYKHRHQVVKLFTECCNVGVRLRSTPGVYTLARAAADALFDNAPLQIRSYFPESWLWLEQNIDDSSRPTLINRPLPDSLTTWEMRAVGLSNNGMCVSEPVRVSVSQEVSVEVALPYAMVRGEQIQLSGSIYNQRDQDLRYSLTLDAPPGICVFRGENSADYSKAAKKYLPGNSVTAFHFYIMAMEAGTHTLSFTLTTIWGKERLDKTLRVTPEGILTEENTGATIDPQGIYGSSKRRVELRNSLPPNVVPNSPVERRLMVTGELFGEMLAIMNSPEGIQRLVNLPRGSAEKELMGLLPLYYVYHYMEQGQHWAGLGPEAANFKTDLKRKMKEGLISIMSFKTRLHDAFSMWKKEENEDPSTWLTALMVRSLAEVDKYNAVDGIALARFVNWLIDSCQKGDGSFLETSKYKPVKLMGAGGDTTEQAAYLTSFVVIAIQNAMQVPECKLQAYEEALKKAEGFLFSKVQSGELKSLYVRAVTAYALTLLDSSSMPSLTLYEGLQAAATIKGSPGNPVVRFWQEESAASDANPLKPHKASAQTVETTAYVLLTVLLRGQAAYAKPILAWITQDQRYGGGFYSTQDTILCLEALAKHSVMTKDANLEMDIKAQYRTKGDLGYISLTENRPLGKSITVTQNDDIILSTGLSTGVSVANLKTVYYKMADDSESCHFDISIDIKPRNPKSNDFMELLPRIIACARYKPDENEVYSESSHTVLEIQLPTGVNALQEDLDLMQDGLESRISNYEINGDRVIIQLDSVPSEAPYCVGFRIQELFVTGMASGSLYRVYEYHDPESSCSKVYFPQERKLLRLCQNDQCHCMAAECCTFRSTMDASITADSLQTDMCNDRVKYAFKVDIESQKAEGDFVTYTAKVQGVFKKGEEDIKLGDEVEFVKKGTCSSTQLEERNQYLVMAASIMEIREHRSFRYKFPLDSKAQVDVWPDAGSCRPGSSCANYLKQLDDFTENILLFGC
ncbi:complement C5 [Engraulis encrasicolus]|uniref:complement C5 n=1 Tax=Engraulis encrasicolus TaxID=184585 RepID=UPI002FD704D4